VILADSSVWIDHIRASDALLSDLLVCERVLMHPCVIGEVALGNIRNRTEWLVEMRHLQQAVVARNDEVDAMIEREKLFGFGIGYVDAHLLASVRLTHGALLWTRDKRLAAAAERLSVAAKVVH
jgi:predicted nucleic acid-binding protein